MIRHVLLVAASCAAASCAAAPCAASAQCLRTPCGPIAGWGDNYFGTLNLPAGSYFNTSTRAAGTLALRADGTMVGCGENFHGMSTGQPGTYLQVAHGVTHSVALREDHTAIAWGLDTYLTGCTTAPPDYLVSVYADDQISGGLRPDGSIVIWGGPQNLPVPPGPGYTDLALADFFMIAIASDGTLVPTGQGSHGRTDVPPGSYSKVRIGDAHCLALRSDGTVIAWGSNLYGQCNVPPGTYRDIGAGAGWSAAIRTDGTVAAWGRETGSGQLHIPTGKFLSLNVGDAEGFAIAACYANCDLSTSPPVLNVNDFICFLNGFAAGADWANCDHSTTPPALNVNDFLCFTNTFAAGCAQ